VIDVEALTPDTTRSATDRTTLVRLLGSDALGVLHRISTQSLLDLRTGEARATLFCDFRGRVLHRAVVAATSDGALWLLREDAPGDALLEFVDKHLFRERVTLSDLGAARVVRPVAGGVGHAPGTVIDHDGMPQSIQLDWQFALRIEPAGTPESDYEETERILHGRPRHGHEIRDAFNPFEIGLAHEVHLSKGCYTGQETLLRLVTYHSVRRQLARVRGAGLPPEPATTLLKDGERVGVLTSAVPHGLGWIGLAVIQRSALVPPARLAIEGGGLIEAPQPVRESRPLGLP
jgi:tRNA-modifying protein YgfZ